MSTRATLPLVDAFLGAVSTEEVITLIGHMLNRLPPHVARLVIVNHVMAAQIPADEADAIADELSHHIKP